MAEDLLWIPRVLLGPLYLADEYLLRTPVGALGKAYNGQFVQDVTNLFTFGERSFGLVPTVLFDFGFRPSIGLYMFFDDFLLRHDALRLTAATGGARYGKADIAYRLPLSLVASKPSRYDRTSRLITRSYLQLEVGAFDRPDVEYWGTGWDSSSDDEGRLEERSIGGGFRFHTDFGESYLESWVTMRRSEFNTVPCKAQRDEKAPGLTYECTNHPISDRVQEGYYPLPTGFGGYSTFRAGSRLLLDSRRPTPEPGSGVALDLRTEIVGMFQGEGRNPTGEWFNFGGSLGGFIDLTGARRVLGLTLDARAIQTKTDAVQVPFSELIGGARGDYLPDEDLLRGFEPGRLLGTSSLTASLGYTWPIWVFIDATLQASVGNVFDDHWKDFQFDRLRFSFAGGFASSHRKDHNFSVLMGFGTRPFSEGGAPDSFRLLVGSTTGI